MKDGFGLEFTVALRLICMSGCRPSGSVTEHWLPDAHLLKTVCPSLGDFQTSVSNFVAMYPSNFC